MKKLNHRVTKIKNPTTGEYEGLPAIAGESAYEIAVRLGTFSGTEEEWNNYIKTERDAAVKAIQDRAQQIIDSLPADYTGLTEDVDALKGDLANKEPLHKVLSATLLTGETTLTFTDTAITDNAMIYIYTDVWGVQPSAVEQSGNTLTLTFDAQSADIGAKVEVR